MNNKDFTPFVKWVGGKRTIIKNFLRKYIPFNYNRYIEPFVGGGAMLCHLTPKNSIINDINNELITTYKVIKNNYEKLCVKLDKYTKNHSKDFFQHIRSIDISNLNDIEIAARFIYLNKSCFNGMYRVNKEGKFNVPMNNKFNVNLYNYDNLTNWNVFLNKNKIDIKNTDYIDILNQCVDGDFVYCDPPYDYEEKNGFVSYSKDGFDKNDQIKLCEKLKELDKKGIKWMLSNHDTTLINKLYKDFNIVKITTNRMINSNASERINSAKEVIIMNYDYKLDYYLNTLKNKSFELETIIDFDKIQKNINLIRTSLEDLNYLICDSIEEFKRRLEKLYSSNKECFKAIFILIAIRNYKGQKILLNDNQIYSFDEIISDIEKIFLFFKLSGLLEMIINKHIKSFYDYAFGIEVGLDTHTRKNRNGIKTEKNTYDQLKSMLSEFGNKVKLSEQVVIPTIDNGNKKIDLVIELENQKRIFIESSFYNSQGSKISETAKSYASLNELININNNEDEFIWLADGQGMKSITSYLKKVFYKGYIYNHETFFENIINIIKKKLNKN